MNIRKIILQKETILSEAGHKGARPVHRVLGMAVIANPNAGRYVEDLSSMFDLGAELAAQLAPEMVKLLGRQPVSYGKAAIVGVNGDMEHGGAILHPKLGKPFREAIGGGKDIICSNVKVGAAGSSIDMPMSNKDNIWSFEEFDTITLQIADAPRPDEIVVAIAIADAGRVSPRIGKGRV